MDEPKKEIRTKREALEALQSIDISELDDEELDEVAGGLSDVNIFSCNSC